MSDGLLEQGFGGSFKDALKPNLLAPSDARWGDARRVSEEIHS
jgi:hypothetical protein